MALKRDDAASEDTTPTSDLVVTKYKMAGEIANRVMKEILEACVEGAKTIDLCELGDRRILEETSKVLKKGDVSKGVAYPTCVSVNNVVCNASPLKSEAEVVLAKHDLAKISLGVQVDGYPASLGHTVCVGASKEEPVSGPKADVMHGAYLASEAALRMLRPGMSSMELASTVDRIAEQFHCHAVQGIVTYRVKRNEVADSEKTIALNTPEDLKSKVKECAIELNDVFAMDVYVSTGEGKAVPSEGRCTIFRKLPDAQYSLKMKASRAFLSEAQKSFGAFPFTLRAFSDEKKARLGVVECRTHNLMESFDVLLCPETEAVAQYKFTAIVKDNGCIRVTDSFFDADVAKTDKKIEDEKIKALLASSARKNKARRRNKKADGDDAGAAEEAPQREEE